jgi:outer membrane protein, heavy metal efflux system
LIRDVTIAFHRAVASERQLNIAEELFRLSDSVSQTARKRVDAGAAPFQEQLRAEIEAEQAGAGLAAYRSDVAARRAELAALMGEAETAAWPLEGELSEDVSPLQGTSAASWNPEHPVLRSALIEREQAEAELGRARLGPYPDMRIGVAGGRNEALREAILEFRISVPLPIFDRGRGKLREAGARALIADAELAGAEQRLIRDWTIAQARHRAASEQVAAYKERILPRTAEAHHLVRGGFEQGKFDFIDLLDVQRTAAEARLTFEEKLLDLNIARAELDALASSSGATRASITIPIQ